MADRSLSPDIQEFLDKKSTRNFIEVSRKVITILELTDIGINEFLKQIHAALIELYAAGHQLELIELKYSDVTDEDERKFDNRYANKISELADKSFYWEVFDPTYTETDRVPGNGENYGPGGVPRVG